MNTVNYATMGTYCLLLIDFLCIFLSQGKCQQLNESFCQASSIKNNKTIDGSIKINEDIFSPELPIALHLKFYAELNSWMVLSFLFQSLWRMSVEFFCIFLKHICNRLSANDC